MEWLYHLINSPYTGSFHYHFFLFSIHLLISLYHASSKQSTSNSDTDGQNSGSSFNFFFRITVSVTWSFINPFENAMIPNVEKQVNLSETVRIILIRCSDSGWQKTRTHTQSTKRDKSRSDCSPGKKRKLQENPVKYGFNSSASLLYLSMCRMYSEGITGYWQLDQTWIVLGIISPSSPSYSWSMAHFSLLSLNLVAVSGFS